MAVSVAAVMRQINNYFEDDRIDGLISISGNAITPAPDALWCCIKGSRYHDGVWRVCGGHIQDMPGDLPDERFTGRVWLLKPPADFLALCDEISTYDDKNPAGAYMQESFGGYSYMRRNSGERSTAWQDVFSGRLASYRNDMFTEVG